MPARSTRSRPMDLHIAGTHATLEERAAVDAVCGPPGPGGTGGERLIERAGRAAHGGRARARATRDLLLPAIEAVQDRVGWVSRAALDYISTRLTVPPAEAYGVASFYHLIALEPT